MRWITFLLCVCWTSLTFAAEYYVGGTGASDSNPGTAAAPFATIQKAASVAASGDVVKIRGGLYRETITPANSGVTFQGDGGTVTISGLNTVAGAWSVHSGNIYKITFNLPVANNFNEYSSADHEGTSNTTLLANQIFKDGTMMNLARWPKVSSVEEYLDKSKFRPRGSTSSWDNEHITDNAIGSFGFNLTGAYVWMNGWFVSQTRQITSHSGSQITFPTTTTAQQPKFAKFYFLTNHLGLLTDEKEWHYQGGVLYFRQPGGGAPTGVEYKARNWGFDLRGKSNITVVGLSFIGCDPVTTSTSSANIVVDNVRAKYMNHAFISTAQGGGGDKRNATQTGTKLIGPNSTIKNSEFKYASAHGIWLGPGGRAENNKLEYIAYDGMWGAPFTPWMSSDNITITKNTVAYTGRGGVELASPPHQHQTNLDISYNDISKFNMLSVDGGAIYSQIQSDHSGTRIHHNWMHDTGITRIGGVDGVQSNGVYLDQASGPMTIDHNVQWNGDECEFYAEVYSDFGGGQIRDMSAVNGGLKIINNTWAGSTSRSYISYANPANSTYFKNNIYTTYIESPNKPLDITNFVANGTNPQFVGSGGGGLNYRIQATSPARNTGMVIAGITDGSVGVPDLGAYEYGAPDWVAGYTPLVTSPTNAAPVVSLTAPANNSTTAVGTAIAITATATDSDGTVAKVEFFDGATKIGEDLVGPYTFSWSTATVGTHTVTAKATDNSNNTSTSTGITVTVTGAANTNPTVSITAPANNATFAAGAAITITATAADGNGTVSKVEFFDGAAKLGEDTSNPYSFSWTNASVGAHAISAKATDNQGAVTTSTVANVTINAAPTPPAPTPPAPTPNTNPIVSITSPSNSASFKSGVSIDIVATASDANGTVAKVEFFDGASKLGEDLSSPYSFTWTNAGVGSHSITAVATDNLGATATSAAVGLTVEVTAVPPSSPPIVSAGSDVSLLLPDNSATLSSTASSAASTNLVYSWNQLSGPGTATMNNANGAQVSVSGLTEGTYVFEVTVTDENGLASKDQVSVVVSAQAAIGQTTIPRFFTPNADGQNDTWVLPDTFTASPTQVTVFNSLGQKVFEEATYTTSWDGKSNGQPLQDDAYYYVIKRQTGSVLQGAVRIMR